MRCQSCLSENEAKYHAVTDALDIVICGSCAEKARGLGIPIKELEIAIWPDRMVTAGGAGARSAPNKKSPGVLEQGPLKSSPMFVAEKIRN